MEHQLNAYERGQNKFMQNHHEEMTDRMVAQLYESLAQWKTLLDASESDMEYADTHLRQYDRGYIAAMKVAIRDLEDALAGYHYEE